MTHFHAHAPDYPCPADNDDTPEDLAAYRAAEKAGYKRDGNSTKAAFDIYTAWRIATLEPGKYPNGKHWNGPEMKARPTAAAERRRVAAAWEARVATGRYVCTLGHAHFRDADGSWNYVGPLGQSRDHPRPFDSPETPPPPVPAPALRPALRSASKLNPWTLQELIFLVGFFGTIALAVLCVIVLLLRIL